MPATVFNSTKSVEVEAVVDTDATVFVLPQNLVGGLALRRIRDAKVKYVSNEVESKWVYGAMTAELKGRVGIFEVLAEETGGVRYK